MTQRQVETYRITKHEQIQALASPVRLEILAAVRTTGPASITDVARFLRLPPDSLYYHVRKLIQVGLVLEAGARHTGRREEMMYSAAGRRFRMPFEPGNHQLTEARLKTFAALLRLTERDHRRAIRSGVAVFSGPNRNIHNARVKGWLSADELREVQARIDEIIDIFEREKPEPHGRGRDLFAVTVYLTPMTPQRPRRAARPPRGKTKA